MAVTLPRRVETFVAGYIGFMNEAATFTDAPVVDIDTPAALTHFAIADRTKQYLDLLTVPTVKEGTIVGSATPYTNFTYQRLGGFFTAGAPLTSGHSMFVSGKSVPLYFLKGAINLGNQEQSNKIDTTGSGDTYMSAVPGRPDATFSFGLRTGPKITLANSKVVTIENRLLQAKRAGEQVVLVFVDDTSDPLLPRDAAYAYVGNANKTRQQNQAVERQFDFYLCVPDDGNLPYVSIDNIA